MQDLPTRPSDAATTFLTPAAVEVGPALRVEVTHDGEGCTVRLGGELDMATAAQLSRALSLVCAGEHHLVVVDLGDLRFLSLAGFRVLADAQHTLQAAGCRLVLSHLDALTRRVLVLAGFDQLLPLLPGSEHRMAEATSDAQQR